MNRKQEAFQLFNNDPEQFSLNEIRRAEILKKKGFPLDFGLRQIEIEHTQLILNTKAHFDPRLKKNEGLKERSSDELTEIKKRPQDFVKSEAKPIEDKFYARIDKWFARLQRLQGRAKQVNQYIPKTKNK